ncbi:amidohydrolase family protein [Phenylobacterium sp.]|uniref:amidohydrolase family protein n=1 Tax=Phenylobacterium sp. TaxID=1871053 RepID=UPI00273687F1|nr:amidohydrolase family protein [Phenylobacterium sp.]MDP3635268.1 amidohydrolase family protein [Phenylobacterium sp.]
MQIIDFECDTPTKEAVEDTVRLIQSGRGFDKEGYAQQMAPGWAAQIGMSLEEFNEAKATVGLTALALKLCEVDMTKAMTHAQVIAMLDGAGVAMACIGNAGRRASNEDVAAFAAEYPDRLIPWFRIWGDEGEAGVAALERGVRERGVRGFEISSYREQRYINDPVYRPYLAKCVELNIPVRITVGVHLLSDRPYDYAHPKYIDELAIAFPTLRIVSGLGGYPWIPDMVAIAGRHQNVFIDFACRRVKYMLSPGAGYEALIYYGARGLQDKIIFGSGWGTSMVPLAQLVAETDELPLKDSVRAKWMGGNAAVALGL